MSETAFAIMLSAAVVSLGIVYLGDQLRAIARELRRIADHLRGIEE